MRYKFLLFAIAFAAVSNNGFAQYAKDAIRFSTFQTGSTSRIKAIGNAGTAIGGDLSSVSGNPAGLGYFTHSELSITPEFDGNTNKATYLGQTSSATDNSVNMNNAAIVFYNRLDTPPGQDKTKGWLSVNFGIAYNRTNNFYEGVQYGAKNNNNSIADYYAKLANDLGIGSDNLQAWAFDQKLIDAYGAGGGSNYTYQGNAIPGELQTGNITRVGGQSAYDFSVGANYSNKLYLGLGVGVTELRYKSTNSFTETGTASVLENNVPANRAYNSTYTQYQNTKGEGFNARLGLMYKILESVRVGAVITSPTFINVNDSFSEGLKTNIANNGNFSNGPQEYPLTYDLRTAFKAAGGLSVFIGKYGFITGDVEYIDYTGTHISSNDNYTNTYDQGIIASNYKSAVNFHTGAEIKITDAVALRGGYAIQGTPLKTNGVATKIVTGGLGYRLGNYYIDATYMHLNGSQTILPYDIGDTTPSASANATNNNFFFTIGYRY